MKYIIGVLSIIIICGLAALVSKKRKEIRLRPIFVMLATQFIMAMLLLKTNVGNTIIMTFAKGFGYLLSYAQEGVNFAFGNLVNQGEMSFFVSVLLPIVFISALIGILQHWHILGFIVKYIGLGLSKINGMGKLESYNAVASAILGQSEVFISIKKQLGLLPEHRLYTLCTSAMSTISMAIVGAYMQLLDPRYVVTAMVLNLLGGFIIASIINPYQVQPEEDILTIQEERQSFFEMLSEYILDGFKVAVIVAAMLIGFIALITMANSIFTAVLGISFQEILGYIFAPLAFLVGIPWEEAVQAGGIMATKIVSNEFVAMHLLMNSEFKFSEHSIAVISVFLVSFANFSSIGIIVGAIKALDSRQGNTAARFGLKLLYGASLVSFLSATVVGLLY
ncbi:NupC/NupG family nucleoside CNT transporter [Pragia fontium]|uniref:Nucleoside transport protein n=2 Tax=Pragia fontium TaxID=82985 RepID=A0AAJ4WD92_9GAMM|nr:nucleoside transporter C-terminal domain-containing protein [Pragia fontium]AKJ43520.1 pyrimidine nucleoside transporter NupC [Pragia fontium]SFD36694.1 nucleoside transport protein [Pragia fontium DSM 5563 = ATCC 49100]SUB84010.1 Nucleoside-transport system protein nupC [Pragia fontium]VEJ56909.1 Nucleoside-transport system protein nupC [Pragia fontium]GKX64220.1 pyrimidine nucleoside transporter NupC [Pragia fontium]